MEKNNLPKINLPLIPFPEEIESTPKERMGFYFGQILSHQSDTKRWLAENKDLSKMLIYKQKEGVLEDLQKCIDFILKDYPEFSGMLEAVPTLDKLKEIYRNYK